MPRTAFLITPFTPARAGNEDPCVFAEVQRAVENAVRDAGLRLDHPREARAAGPVMDQIREAIGAADVVLAIHTGANPNAFIETGVALERALRPPILIAPSVDVIPFDIRHYRICTYGTEPDLTTLQLELERALRDTLAGPVSHLPNDDERRQRAERFAHLRDRVRRRCAERLDKPPLTVALRDINLDLPLPTNLTLGRGVTARKLASGTRLIHVLELPTVMPALFVLGRAGTGKTTSLVELARDLLDRTPGAAVPVLVNLSSWVPSEPISEWLKGQLSSWYLVNPEDARQWLEGGRLFLLLDGLDEVSPSQQATCVWAIIDLLHDEQVRVPGVVISSRIGDYERLSQEVTTTFSEISVESLEPDQVAEYLARAGPPLGGLAAAMEGDATLQILASTPLMLKVMTLAYAGVAMEQVAVGRTTAEATQRHIFATYVFRMFEYHGEKLKTAAAGQPHQANFRTVLSRVRAYPKRTGTRHRVPTYSEARTRRWLISLACRLRSHAEVGLLIERLQPSWLDGGVERWLYAIMSRVVGGIALGGVFGMLIGFVSRELADLLVVGVAAGGGAGGLAAVIDACLLRRGPHQRDVDLNHERRWRSLVLGVYLVALLGPAWLVIRQNLGASWRHYDGASAVMALAISMPFALFFGWRSTGRRWADDIRPVEALQWSLRHASRSGRRGVTYGLLLGFMLALPLAELQRGPTAIVTVVGGAVGLLVGLALGGWVTGRLPSTDKPNQGVMLSARNALSGGARLAVASGAVLTGLAIVLDTLRPPDGIDVSSLWVALVGALFFGFLAVLWYGGLDVIYHYVLRILLAIKGHAPLRYAHFLENAAALSLLKRVGGGYEFVHPLLFDYFAEGAPIVVPNTPGPRSNFVVSGSDVVSSLIRATGPVVPGSIRPSSTDHP